MLLLLWYFRCPECAHGIVWWDIRYEESFILKIQFLSFDFLNLKDSVEIGYFRSEMTRIVVLIIAKYCFLD